MFCTTCGNKIPENQKFCTKCGAKVSKISDKDSALIIPAAIPPEPAKPSQIEQPVKSVVAPPDPAEPSHITQAVKSDVVQASEIKPTSIIPQLPPPAPSFKKSSSKTGLIITIIVVVILMAGGVAYWKFIGFGPSADEIAAKGKAIQDSIQQVNLKIALENAAIEKLRQDSIIAAQAAIIAAEEESKNNSQNQNQPKPKPKNLAVVRIDRAYFYSQSDLSTKSQSFLVKGEKVNYLDVNGDFIYAIFTNVQGVQTKGWLLKSDCNFP